MSHVLILTLLLGLSLSAASLPARAQSGQTAAKPAPPPEVDPDAASYSTAKVYTPPGVLKSVEIGNFYLKRKKYKAALSRFEEAVAEDSTYAPAYLGLGKSYDYIGLKQKALDAYKKYLDALPSQKDALDAKETQRDIARLEQEIKTPHPAKQSRAQHAESPPQ
jgi:tetratricopeptide (TPR) repeat protein